MNMTFQVLGAGMISLSVEMSAGRVPCGFQADRLLLMVVVAVDGDGDGGDEDNENDEKW
jgi:hypothetical protein